MKNETTAITSPAERNNAQKQNVPSIEQWLKKAKQQPDADQCGMYLFHNGVVRGTAKAQVRHGENSPRVTEMQFSFDQKRWMQRCSASRRCRASSMCGRG